MKVGIMQPYFFPYIGYWQLINLVDEYIIYDDVNYIKRGWINRNNILLNGQSKMVNLHIRDASQNRLIRDTQLAQTKEDTRKLLATIVQCYRKAPYFDVVYELLENIMNYEDKCLSEYLAYQLQEVCRYLNIQTRLLRSSEIEKDTSLKGEEKIIEICKKRHANSYINASGGKELYHHKNFMEKGMELKFLRTGNVCYKQFDNDFVPNLSIIDVMMFNSVEKIGELLQQYSLEQ